MRHQSARGAAALINLLVSLGLLGILILLFLPNLAHLPSWARDWRNFTLVERRQVLHVESFTRQERERIQHLLIINTQFRGKATDTLLREINLSRRQDVFLTYRSLSNPHPLWEVKLSPKTTLAPIATTFDYDRVYVVVHQRLYVYRRSDGSLLWQSELPDELPASCHSCLVSSTDSLVWVLTRDKTLTAYHKKQGSTVWRAENIVANTRAGIYPRDNGKSTHLWLAGTGTNVAVGFEAHTGKTITLAPLPAQYKILPLPILFYDADVYFFYAHRQQVFLGSYALHSLALRGEGLLLPATPVLASDFAFIGENRLYFQNRQHEILQVSPVSNTASWLSWSGGLSMAKVLNKYPEGILWQVRRPDRPYPEVWAMRYRDGQIIWRYDLGYTNSHEQGLSVAAWVEGKEVFVLEKNNARLQITRLALQDGKPISKENVAAREAIWQDYRRYREGVLLIIRNLYHWDSHTNHWAKIFP